MKTDDLRFEVDSRGRPRTETKDNLVEVVLKAAKELDLS